MNDDRTECAFPVPDDHPWSFGMTLRDYFAAKAMQVYLIRDKDYRRDFVAVDAYAMADAMMEARNQ